MGVVTSPKKSNATMMFLEPCKEQHGKLNTDKLNLRQNEVSLIGYVSTDKGLRVDSAKPWAIS